MNSESLSDELIKLQLALELLSGDTASRLKYLNKKLEEELREEFVFELLLNLAKIYETQKDFERLYETQIQLLPLARKYKEGEELLGILSQIANNVFFNLGNFEKALEYNQEVIYSAQSNSTLSRPIHLANSYNLVGIILYTRTYGDMLLALGYLNKGLNIYTQIGDKYGLAKITNNIGLVYKNNEKYENAISYYTAAIKYLLACDTSTEFYYRNYITYCCNLSSCFIELKRLLIIWSKRKR
jgi:tetratricopeptide (TPR) repeat protein